MPLRDNVPRRGRGTSPELGEDKPDIPFAGVERARFGKLPAIARRLAAGFLGDRRGGAMLVALSFVLMAMAGAGSGLVNLSWQELHREQIRNASRAAVAAAGAPLLARAGDGGAVDAEISAKVKNFVEATVATVSVSHVAVHYDSGRVAVDVAGDNAVPPLWGRGGTQPFAESVAVRLAMTSHEFAFALDMSGSMGTYLGGPTTRMQALQAAMQAVATNLQAAQNSSSADIMVAIVPFLSAVRVADTGGAGDTAGKRRYVELLGGRLNARWVDVYHHYGIGGTHEISLPAGWDWDRNVWTGCVMARWGAYWDPLAGVAQWPATLNGEPLHLSDAPPDPNNPHTLFTAYSWPDAESAGAIDADIQFAMTGFASSSSYPGDNSWSVTYGGGDAMCPDTVLTPLTDQIGSFVSAVNALQPHSENLGSPTTFVGMTHAHQGIVWGIRALSPHWQDIWGTTDFRGAKRPAAYGDVRKALLIVSDGENYMAAVKGAHRALQLYPTRTVNPRFRDSELCGSSSRALPQAYHDLAVLSDADLNLHFSGKPWRADLAGALGVPALAADLATYDPADVFRNVDGALSDLLVSHGLPRPRVTGRHLCDWWSGFTPYGRIGDPLYVGGDPVFGHSPFPSLDSMPSPYDSSVGWHDRYKLPVARLNQWFIDACGIAAARGIRIHAIFIGDNVPGNKPHLDGLEACAARAGGEMLVTPDRDTLKTAMESLVDLERRLSFTD